LWRGGQNRFKRLKNFRGLSETGHHGKGRDSAEYLRLVVGVFVIPFGTVRGKTGIVFPEKTFPRLKQIRMRLNGKGLFRGNQFEQKRKLARNIFQTALTFIRLHRGRSARVGSHPHFRHWFSFFIFDSKKTGYRFRRTPFVEFYLIVKFINVSHYQEYCSARDPAWK
jgi:hypothetical protein